ncbi:MAG: hypothetical protein KJ726_04695, partial [Verrucomicrobia bacterium]|nr:hypothetical protein [Verrucomicrobiota bacterium]
MNTGRIASAALALIYLVAAYIGGGGEALLKTVIFLTLPLACIWFSDELGAFTGVMRGQHINATT